MSITNDIWTRSGSALQYPGLKQSEDTCVFMSVAGAINFLASTAITEQQILSIWNADGRPQPTFDLALKYLLPEITSNSIHPQRFHDHDAPLPSIDVIFTALDKGAVVIPSFELATGTPDRLARVARWHMLSLFSRRGGQSQVWDTNNKTGFICDDDVRKLFVSDFPPIPYQPPGYLISHDQHEVIIVMRS